MNAAAGLDGTLTAVDFEMSPTVGKIGAALAAAQKQIANPKADSPNPFFKSKYADLAAVIDAVRDPLSDHEIARAQFPLSRDGETGLLTILIHSSGEWIRSRVFCKPLQPGPQALGSVLTYLRRYSLAAATGLAQTDDDANAASATVPEAKREKKQRMVPMFVQDRVKGEWTQIGEAPALSQGQQAEIKILQAELQVGVEQWQAKLYSRFGKRSSAELSTDEARSWIDVLDRNKAARTSPPVITPATT